MNVSANFLFLLLFMGFFAWLFVIYWIRHHEPLANHVVGTGAAQSATAAADRQLVEGIKNAMPMHTRADFGEVYVPNKPLTPVPGPTGLVHAGPSPSAVPSAQFSTFSGYQPAAQFSTFAGSGSVAPQNFAQPAYNPGQGAYVVPDGNSTGARVKMIVNR